MKPFSFHTLSVGILWLLLSGRCLADSPTQETPADTSKHWAFRPLVLQSIPTVQDAAWPRNPLDRFILAALEARGLRPAPLVDRRTLIRRASFDLTGLPPTPEEIEAFLSDQTPDPFARVVDRLLASSAYGERWGRHWLDVARYADSNGLDENIAHGNAWRYRDYVVNAFNRDKPYDRFLIEQLAGDLLPAEDATPRDERLIATGFLSLGPKVLAEPDARKMELDIVDEQVDTVGRAFMAVTIGCARCHDHKFDPFPIEDYYGLAGIFLSTRTMENFKKVARWHENPLASADVAARQAEFEAKKTTTREAITKLVKTTNAQIRAAAKQVETLPNNLESLYPPEARAELKRLQDELARLEKAAPALPTAMGVMDGSVTDAAVLPRGNFLNPGKIVPRHFPSVLAGKDQRPAMASQSGRLELGRWLARKEHPLTGRVMVNRIWHWHFSQGLVRSVDNFGKLGEKPSHPELLDWLAVRFTESGWSIKALHRLIMLSSTYQMSSAYNAAAAETDPDNRLHWRTNVRRLEAEAIRDALLAVSGSLDQSMGGSLLHVQNRGYLFDHTSKDATKYDSRRRAVYLPVIRNNLYDVYQLLDATDATVGKGDRTTTTVATQALFMMNSDLVIRASEQLAARLLASAELDWDGRLRLLYQTVYGRLPTTRELERAGAVVEEFERNLRDGETDAGKRQLRAWAWLCHVLVAANEFVYVK